jgi:hypothetical protein
MKIVEIPPMQIPIEGNADDHTAIYQAWQRAFSIMTVKAKVKEIPCY